jgi:hypothetical protein
LYGNLNFEAVKKYIAYRAERGWKPLKQSRLNVLAKRLIDYPLQVQMAMVDQTIGNGWQGVFDVKTRIGGLGSCEALMTTQTAAEFEAAEEARSVRRRRERASVAENVDEILALFDQHRVVLGESPWPDKARLRELLGKYTFEQQRTMLVAAIDLGKPTLSKSVLPPAELEAGAGA